MTRECDVCHSHNLCVCVCRHFILCFLFGRFAFAETISQEEVAKAVKAMESTEINGRRLRVRSAADKDKKGPRDDAGSSQPK